MDTTPRLKLPYIAPQQAQKQVTYNEAMRALDLLVQPVVKSRALATPPGGPAEGDAYLVATSPTGAWSGKAGKIACWVDGAWMFHTPLDGWLLYVEAGNEFIQRQAGSWVAVGTSFPQVGINATADATTRLALAAAQSLFSHDGAGHRLAVNKAAAGNTASQIFETGFSGRAELGLVADDNFHLRVSPDGSAWSEALTVDRTTAAISLGAGRLGFPATQNASSDPNTLDDYEEGTWTPTISFGGASVGVVYGAANAGRYTKIGRLCVASFALQLSNKGSSTGAAAVGGLPFAVASGGVPGTLSVGYATGLSSVSGTVLGTVAAGGTSMALHALLVGTASALTNTNFTSSAQIHGVVVFETA